MIKYIDLKVKIKDITSQELEKAFSIFDSQSAKFNKIFKAKEIQDEIQFEVMIELMKKQFLYKGLTKELTEKFIVKEIKSGSGKNLRKTFTLYHDWFLRKYPDIKRKSGSGREHILSRRALYKIVDTGRKEYQIPSKANFKISANPLKFYWKRESRWVTFYWRGKRGGRSKYITVRPHSYKVDFNTGARVTDVAFRTMNAFVDEQFDKME